MSNKHYQNNILQVCTYYYPFKESFDYKIGIHIIYKLGLSFRNIIHNNITIIIWPHNKWSVKVGFPSIEMKAF